MPKKAKDANWNADLGGGHVTDSVDGIGGTSEGSGDWTGLKPPPVTEEGSEPYKGM